MTCTRTLCTIAISAILLSMTSAGAQTVSDDSQVWAVIEQSWRAEREGDSSWIEERLSADFVGWSNDAPAPRDKSSTRLWNAFAAKQSEILEYELYPLSIIVHGDTAVAHYLYSSATKPKGQPVEVNNGRYTDVLVRVDGQWKFISWHGGDSP